MEFYFANYQTSEFAFKVWCETKQVTADKLDNYPQEATHFVERVYYGMRMFIFFDQKYSHFFDKHERLEFLGKVWKGEQKLTKEQENAECSLLIFAKNPEETTVKQMKMSQVLQLFEDFKNEKYPEYETVFYCDVAGLTGRSSVFNEKFEKRMKLFGEKCFKSFAFLRNSEHKNLIKKEQTTDGILPNANQMDSQAIIMDKNLLYSMKRKVLHCLKMKILLLNNVNEPQIWNISNSNKYLFGFAVNRGQFEQEAIDSSKLFVSLCPQKCTNDDRQWICINCGTCFYADGYDVMCDCGTTHVSNLDYECCDPNHPKTVSLWRAPEHIASISAPETSPVKDELLESIKQQLKKHAEFENESKSRKPAKSESENRFPALFFDKTSIYFLKMETIQQLKMPIILSNDAEKPYVWNSTKKILLGFVSHLNQPTADPIEGNQMLVMRCPKKCSNEARQWICITCGFFLKAEDYDVVCDCGVANVTDLIFECFEPTHLKTFTIWQTPLLQAAAIFTAEQKSMLDVIKQQLEKIFKKDGLTAADKLSNVIQSIKNYDGPIVDQLETLDLTNLDGDTVNLINNFLASLN